LKIIKTTLTAGFEKKTSPGGLICAPLENFCDFWKLEFAAIVGIALKNSLAYNCSIKRSYVVGTVNNILPRRK
jgi:hypothetical protein